MGDDARAAPDAVEVEVEWQFDAPDLHSVERWLAALPARAAELLSLPMLTVRSKPTRRLVDRYVDTEDWRLGQAGLVLRTRTRDQHQEATLKDLAPATEGGLRRRLEVTEDLPAGDLEGLGPEGPVGWRVAAVAGKRPLLAVLEVRTRRQPFSVRCGTEEVAEVALDQTVVVPGNGREPAHLLRVEVEVAPEWADTLQPLVEELGAQTGLRPATRSKYETGLLAAGVTLPGPPDLGPTDVGEDATLAELAFAMARGPLAMLLAREPGTRLGEDPEELHRLRVATRRLRAVLKLFADAFPAPAAALREDLAWMTRTLGAVRDLDVQLGRLDQMATSLAGAEDLPAAGEDDEASRGEAEPLVAPVVADVRSLLEAQRAVARRQLLAALDTDRWERAKAALVRLVTEEPPATQAVASLPAALVVGQLVEERHRRAAKAARRARRSGAPADLHRLRIQCKRLRYSVELTTPVYGAPAQRFIRTLAKLQDGLGLLQDDVVARAQLRTLATEPPADHPPLPPATVFALGGIAERYRLDTEVRARSMVHRLGKLTGRSWKDLAAAIEERRAAAAAAPPAAPLDQGVHAG